MDPLSMAASLIAIMQLAQTVVGYFNDVKDASKEQRDIAMEISSVNTLLTPLKCRVESVQSADPWFQVVRMLGDKGGPLDQFESTLKQLKSKLDPVNGFNKAVRLLAWSFNKTEVKAMQSRIERVKTLAIFALANDTLTLAEKIQEGLSDVKVEVLDVAKRVADVQLKVDGQERRALDQERRDITDWLSPLNFKAKQNEVLIRRQEGTGQWLLESEAFQKWINGTEKKLWCPGIPGAGKTILASIVVNYLQTIFKGQNVAVACIYCNYKEQIGQTYLTLIGSLLKQLVQDQPLISPNIRNLYDTHVEKNTSPAPTELLAALKLEIGAFSRVFIIVDAIDECSEDDKKRENLLDTLLSLPENVKLLVTSRPLPTIQTDRAGIARLDIRADDQDVRMYVKGRIPREKRLARHIKKDPNLGETLVETIVKSAKGMFLLAQLYMDSLVSKNNGDAIRDALQHPPEKVQDTYKDAMTRIQEQSKDDRELAWNVLSWISFALRPLLIEELQHALAVMPGDVDVRRGAFPDEEIMISVCAGLVVVNEESGVLRLIHYTAQEFFNETRESTFPNAQINIASTCITYLSFRVFEQGPCADDDELEARFIDYAFLEYAAKYWGHHAQGKAEEACQNRALMFLENNSKILCASQVMHVGPYERDFPIRISGLHIAAFFGMKVTADRLLKNGTELDLRDNNGQTPLSWAARNGREAVVKLLLEKGAELESKDSRYGQTPLSWAAEYGCEAVVRLLVKKGAELESKDSYGRTPLSWAASNGHEAVIKLLVEKGAELESKDSIYGQTPLSWAAEYGHEAVFKLLVEKGAELESKDGSGQTPLSLAARNEHEPVVKLLLEKGAELESKDSYGRTPLSLAARNGYETVVKLLVEKGAELESKDSDGRTPLSWAARNEHEPVVKLLLEKGAELESKDSRYGQTPLSWAAEYGCEAVVRLLVKKGAELESKDSYGRTPLSWAASNGHEAVIKLLLEKGAKNYRL